MNNGRTTAMLALLLALTLAPSSGNAQLPAEEQPDETPGNASAWKSESVERFGTDLTVGVDERVWEAVVIGGDIVVRGEVAGDLVSILGSATLGSTAEVGGDVVVLVGPLTVESGAQVRGDVVAILGSLDAPADFSPGGDFVSLVSVPKEGLAGAFPPWLADGLAKGRPIAPNIPWVWGVVLVFALLYLGINFIFDEPVRKCASALSDRPLTTCLAGVLVLLLIGPVSFLLAISIIGLPVIPFMWCGVMAAALVGRVGVARWIGGRVVPEQSLGSRLEALRSLGIGLAAFVLLYMVPVLGFATWTVVGVVGLGAAATTFVRSLRSEQPRQPPRREALTVPAEVEHEQVARFASRFGAVLLDIILVMIVAAMLDLEGGFLVALLLAYHVALWTWKGTTVGGIICQVRIVRADGEQVQFTDALVRALGSIFSVAVAGLGWLWMLWDADRQTWHDKIAGTLVVRVPRTHRSPEAASPTGADLP